MIKKISLLLGLIAALPASSFAWVGGPFSNGDFSESLDDNGIYQASFTFKNGSGYAQWATNAALSGQSRGGGGTSNGSVVNRSVVYSKGITYFGMATGISDLDKGYVYGNTNGSSDAQSNTQGAGNTTTINLNIGGGGGSGASSGSAGVVANGGRNFIANSQFTAKVTSSHPILRFRGTGEISFLGADATGTIAGLAQEILEQVNGNLTPQQVPIPTSQIRREPNGVDGDGNIIYETITTARPVADIIADQQALLEFGASVSDQILSQLLGNLEAVRQYLGNSPSNEQDVVTEKLKVVGLRKYFISAR
jgi:hypothetical protein